MSEQRTIQRLLNELAAAERELEHAREVVAHQADLLHRHTPPGHVAIVLPQHLAGRLAWRIDLDTGWCTSDRTTLLNAIRPHLRP